MFLFSGSNDSFLPLIPFLLVYLLFSLFSDISGCGGKERGDRRKIDLQTSGGD
jgi:hypothetical protein